MTGNPLLHAELVAETGFRKFIAWFSPQRIRRVRRAKKRFRQLAGTDELIDFSEWERALGVRNKLIAKRLFDLVDTDSSGFIDLNEYQALVNCLANKKSDQRLNLVFAIYDQDGDGFLQIKDIQELLAASMEEQSLTVTDEDMEELSSSFMNYFQGAKKNKLEITEFVIGIKSYPKLDRLFEQFIAQWLYKSGKTRGSRGLLQAGAWTRRLRYMQSHWAAWLWTLIYVYVNGYLFMRAMDFYAHSGATLAVQIARGLGACLNFNVALMLLLMARALWSRLRHTFLSHLLPLDSFVDFHRRIGWMLLVVSAAHTVAHCYNYWETYVHPYTLLFNVSFLTGVAASLAFLIMLAGVAYRNSRRRERFAVTHLFYAVFLVAVLYHGQHFWMWIAPALLIYALDALYRKVWMTRKVKIISMEPLSDGVTRVRFAKPAKFRFHPGDYLYLRLAGLSRWQWHPFTFSAAPEVDHVDLHVRNNGNWTGALYNLSRKSNVAMDSLVAHIDGPYGAPTTHISKSKVAVMIAAGIGVTPFASALESVVLQRQAQADAADDRVLYFHWLNRSQASYEWFQQLLLQAETVLRDQFKLYIHLTSFNHNLTNIAMQIAVEEFYKTHKRDPFTQLHAITSPGRPNWPLLFTELRTRHGNQSIQVFYCGPKQLGRDLKRHCYNFGFQFYKEKFD
ncbi:MAG TPA: ferric reductase-like transmembrane domain-containing protein [Steroidobacteraceae bacterium]|nr:ferric reductase-like transmembrane domain-containing protein [Steroidobacteraceae bacterium]